MHPLWAPEQHFVEIPRCVYVVLDLNTFPSYSKGKTNGGIFDMSGPDSLSPSPLPELQVLLLLELELAELVELLPLEPLEDAAGSAAGPSLAGAGSPAGIIWALSASSS